MQTAIAYMAGRLTVEVLSRTGGATWSAEVFDSTGYRRDLTHADEGGDHPHRWMAEREAREIAARTGARVRVRPIV